MRKEKRLKEDYYDYRGVIFLSFTFIILKIISVY